MKFLLLTLTLILTTQTAYAALKTQFLTYSAGDADMESYLAYDEAQTGPRPAIILVPDWMGLGDFAKTKAQELAKLGYVALAADVYGKGIRPQNADEAGKLATRYKDNRPLLRKHMRAAFDQILKMKEVDPHKIVVMGYCFGGTAALELARSGAPLVGTVTFHGGLSNPTPEDAKNIKGRVLVLHGADDPYVPPAEVKAFKAEMEKAHVPVKFIAYPGAVHAFTIPSAGNDNSKGAAYNADADKKSWQEFQKFLDEIFQKQSLALREREKRQERSSLDISQADS